MFASGGKNKLAREGSESRELREVVKASSKRRGSGCVRKSGNGGQNVLVLHLHGNESVRRGGKCRDTEWQEEAVSGGEMR